MDKYDDVRLSQVGQHCGIAGKPTPPMPTYYMGADSFMFQLLQF